MNTTWIFIGDIIKGIECTELTTPSFWFSDSDKKNTHLSYPISKYNLFVYLSHECAFNAGKTKHFLLAPLVPTPSQQDVQLMEASNNIRISTNFISSFFYNTIQDVIERPSAVDFNRIFSVSAKMRDKLLKNKVYELDESQRKLLKTKLGFYFSHPSNETKNQDLSNAEHTTG